MKKKHIPTAHVWVVGLLKQKDLIRLFEYQMVVFNSIQVVRLPGRCLHFAHRACFTKAVQAKAIAKSFKYQYCARSIRGIGAAVR